ncbi:hypothetical protein GCM10010215_16070 [Streptomyces virginiae]|uniref:Uncharacterized protein n=1 Tax=Streptomyces virginiae TaxID=1961 RepID=A0ABQ3P057_STRVG|nr:hypothetical protein GCM10010215_16070 [Streptomyces virginiae]GHI18409.1 hypothetical protein Scinn_78720 [Streptomyces virginiae]
MTTCTASRLPGTPRSRGSRPGSLGRRSATAPTSARAPALTLATARTLAQPLISMTPLPHTPAPHTVRTH